LCGRDREIAYLGALLRRGRGALLAGPSGVGKTRLASAIAGELEPGSWTRLHLVASQPAAGIPLGALAGLLTPGELSGDGVPAVLQARAGIAAIAASRPVVVVLDDAQWLDEASAVVLHQLVARDDVTLLATLRTGEPAPDSVTVLWKDGLVERIDVAPLGDESVRDLLEAVLDGPVETLSATRLWQRCAGNALYLQELLGEAARLGLLQRREGLWCLDTLPPGSARLGELVAERFGSLTNTSARRSKSSPWASRSASECSTIWPTATRWSVSRPPASSPSAPTASTSSLGPPIRCTATSYDRRCPPSGVAG
jgi:hypothetical protein